MRQRRETASSNWTCTAYSREGQSHLRQRQGRRPGAIPATDVARLLGNEGRRQQGRSCRATGWNTQMVRQVGSLPARDRPQHRRRQPTSKMPRGLNAFGDRHCTVTPPVGKPAGCRLSLAPWTQSDNKPDAPVTVFWAERVICGYQIEVAWNPPAHSAQPVGYRSSAVTA